MWGEVPLPEDLEASKEQRIKRQRVDDEYLFGQKATHYIDDDEDFAGDEESGGATAFSCLNLGHTFVSFQSKEDSLDTKQFVPNGTSHFKQENATK